MDFLAYFVLFITLKPLFEAKHLDLCRALLNINKKSQIILQVLTASPPHVTDKAEEETKKGEEAICTISSCSACFKGLSASLHSNQFS